MLPAQLLKGNGSIIIFKINPFKTQSTSNQKSHLTSQVQIQFHAHSSGHGKGCKNTLSTTDWGKWSRHKILNKKEIVLLLLKTITTISILVKLG